MEEATGKEITSNFEAMHIEKDEASDFEGASASSPGDSVVDKNPEKVSSKEKVVVSNSANGKHLESSANNQTTSSAQDKEVNAPLHANKITLPISDNTSSSLEPTKVKVDVEFIRPKTPEPSTSGLSTPAGSPVTPRDGVSLVVLEDCPSSTSSTPREGSPSPDEIGKLANKDKLRVNLGKDLSLMMQALNSLQSPEEKIAALCKKYADLLDQQKLLQKQLKISQRKQAQTIKEKDQVQTDNAKALSARSKLENLCRELQKRNKAIKEEQHEKSLEEVALRQEMAAEFQTTLNRIQNEMRTAVDGSSKLQSENERIGGKLNEIVEKYQARESALESLVKQHNLQEQLVSAELEKAVLEHQEEKKRDAEEKHKLLEQVLERTVQYEAKVKQEKELRTQLQYYSEKFEDFQSTLGKSNEIFTSFRSEMDKMSKKLKQAEKYRATIQKKWEDSTKALANTVEYTQQLEAKLGHLEKLSRALQAERNELAQRLRHYEGNNKAKEGSSQKKTLDEQGQKAATTETKKPSPNPIAENRNATDAELIVENVPTNDQESQKGQCEEKSAETETNENHMSTVQSEKPNQTEHRVASSSMDSTGSSTQTDRLPQTSGMDNSSCQPTEMLPPVAKQQVIEVGK